ncbi:restriction endonuclease subunit S [Acinetobacter radioresistens]|uniref:restriction endonuclease subunit S n=1 Tax=Acinetobacter radioresistens TaxID=40216 RepID=UPI0032B58734
MAKYQAYTEYKDSGVEWLGEIPRHWDSKPLKYLCTYNDEVLPETTAKDAEIQYIDIGSVSAVDGISKIETMIFKDAPSRARRIVRDGDVIVSTVRTYLEAIAPINNPPENLIVSTGFAVIRPNQYLYKSFASYCLRAKGFIKEVVARSVGVSYPAINSSDLVNIAIPSIEYVEQVKIANFLDHETAQIDSLIAKQEKLIELLKEKRQAVISHAVTKGLDPNVPMKDSGVAWLGEVPEHWKIMKLGIAVFMQEGPGLRTWQFTDSGTRVICVTNITEDGINFSKLEKFISTSEYIQSYQHFTVNKGDVLLSSSGNSWGKIATYDDDELVILNTSTIRLNELPSKIIDQNYIRYILSSISTREQLGLMMTGSCQPNFGPSHLKEVKVMVPPIHEQTKIINAIQEIIVKFDNLINKADKQISLMQERRTALISAAVTGKIDVRNWQAPTVTEADTELSA